MLFKFALRNVTRNRRRSIVAVSTVAAGVFGLIFLKSFFGGLLAMHAENSIHSRFGNGQVTTHGYWESTFEKPWEHWIADHESLRSSLLSMPEVAEVFPRVQFYALLSNGSVNVAGKGQGIVGRTERTFFNRMNFVSGGPIGESESGITLGIGLAKALGAKVGNHLTVMGQTVDGSINAIDVVVTGIFHVGMKEADDVLFQVQLSQAKILINTEKVEALVIALKSGQDWSSLVEKISTRPDLEILSVNELDQAWSENGRLFLTALMNIFQVILVGMILLSIYNTASNTILERKREFGMLRANGESNRNLIALMTVEGMVVALIGAGFGLLLMATAHIIFINGITMPPTPGTNRAIPVPLSFDSLQALGVIGVAIVATALSTFVCSQQIARISIGRALKSPL